MQRGIQTILKKAAHAPVGLVKLVSGITALESSNRYAALAASHPELPHRLTPKEAKDIGWRFGILGNNAANALSAFAGLAYTGVINPLQSVIDYNSPENPIGIALGN